MCGPDCTTTTTPRNSAAAIAVIHSTAPTTATSNQLRLFFTNAACPATGFTRVSTDAQALAATTGPTLGLAIQYVTSQFTHPYLLSPLFSRNTWILADWYHK